MSSYIKSEFYRIIRYKGAYLFIIICSLLLLSTNVVLAAVKFSDSTFPWATTYFSFANVYASMVPVFFLCIMVSNMIFGNEHNNHTMKNSISYGISRGTIYFGKLFVQIVYAILSFVIIIGVHVISGYFLLENSGPQELRMLLTTCFVCLPILLFGIAATNCFVFNIESTGSAMFATCGLMIAFPIITGLLGMKFLVFEKLANILPWNMLNAIDFDLKNHQLLFIWDTQAAYRNYWILGIGHMILIAFIGYMLFSKKEIK